MNAKVLTVSIAAFNVDKYIEQTLNSLIIDDEHLRKLEVLVVNDGSTDDTAKIINCFAEKYPEIIKVISKENGGYGSTINRSIGLANGKFFKQLDGDDWYKTKFLCRFIDYLENCDSDLVVAPFYKVYEGTGKEELVDIHNIMDSVQFIDGIEVETNLSMQELAVRTQVLRENHIRITEKCFYTDNEYTIYSIIHAETISKFPDPIYCYRLGRSGQSVSLEGARRHHGDTEIVANNIFAQINNNIMLLNANKGKYFISVKLRNVVDMVYTYYLIMKGDKNSKSRLILFDKHLRDENLLIYRLSNSVIKIRILRITFFWAYRILAIREYNKWKRLESD